MEEAQKNVEFLQNSIENKKLSTDSIEKLKSLKEMFKMGIPTEKEISTISNRVSLVEENGIRMNILKDKKYDTIINKFQDGTVNEETISLLEESVSQYNSDKLIYDNMPQTILSTSSTESEHHINNKIYVILSIICIVLIGSGVGLLFVSQIVGIVLLCLGGLGVLITAFMYLRNLSINNHPHTGTTTITNPEKIAYFDTIIKKDVDDIYQIIAKYGYYDSDVKISVAKFIDDYKKYNRVLQEINDDKTTITNLEQSILTNQTEITNFFKEYQITISNNNYSNALVELTTSINEYINLKEKSEESDEAIQTIHDNLETNKKVIVSFNAKYHLEIKQELIKQIYHDIHDIITKEQELEKATKDIKNYQNEHQLTNRPDTDVLIDTVQVTEELNKMRSDFTKLKYDIRIDEEEVAKMDDSSNLVDELKEKIAFFTSKNQLFEFTWKSLQQAEQNQKDRYAKPVKDRFMHYTAIIKNVIGENVLMDRDYKITYEKNGEQRKVEHLSSGEFSICALCFRFALLDNMYDQNQPFIIMDDPFVNLDENNMKSIKKLVSEISKERQIIYFACHDSRLIQ